MPDVSCVYTLSGTPAITFNSGSADQYYIGEIPTGLAGAPITLPVDPVPFSDDSVSYQTWRRGRHITVEGIFLITSTRVMNNILAIRNDMEDDLRTCLESITGTGTATFAFTPLGQSASSLTVKNDVPLECLHDQGYLVRTFSFGLFADSASL